MADDWKKEFSREELESMGETVEETTTPGPDTQEAKAAEAKPAEEDKTEPTPEPEQKEEAKPEEDKKPEEAKPEAEPEPEEGKPVPYDRFKKVYRQAKETEREREIYKEKLDLFRRDQTEYYAKYPDEKPADYKAKETADEAAAPAAPVKPPVRIIPMRQMMQAIVNDPQTPDYHGRSLRDLMAEGTPESIAAAYDYYNTYVESVREEAQKYKNREVEAYNEIRREAETFLDARAKELYEKPFDELTKEDQDKVEAVGNQTLEWMKKNNLSHYRVQDAYKLMRHDELITKAREQGASSLVDLAKKGNVRSVQATQSTQPADPYGKYMAMKEEELTDMVMKMPDAEYSKFLKNATPAFRKKFPTLPYTV